MSTDTGSSVSPTTSSMASDVKHTIIRRASLVMKPPQQSPASSPGPNPPSTPISLTSKEWIVPPRPKPGRKPATDTPPTKRKAQNRAAQRAFRERRAARVGELEEQMKVVDDENDRQQDMLKVNIERLEKDVEGYRADLVTWMDRCRKLEKELEPFKSGQITNVRTTTPRAKDSIRPFQTSQDDTTVIGCGKCTLKSRCQCIDDAFDAINAPSTDFTSQSEKRPQSPTTYSSGKRVKIESQEDLEIDFTSVFASKSQLSTRKADETSTSSALADPCGFCSDGTPCICAEMAAADQQHLPEAGSTDHARAVHISETHQFSRFTPPPSEDDVLSTSAAPANFPKPSCFSGSGPGTCAQCQADPNSTLFCKSLAASRSQSAANACCGSNAPGGSCCQSTLRTTRARAAAAAAVAPTPPKSSVTLTCADAYTALSRHSGYDRATGEMASWMPRLHATDVAKMTEGRPALEIDAANVMTVLRGFDRRFGSS